MGGGGWRGVARRPGKKDGVAGGGLYRQSWHEAGLRWGQAVLGSGDASQANESNREGAQAPTHVGGIYATQCVPLQRGVCRNGASGMGKGL